TTSRSRRSSTPTDDEPTNEAGGAIVVGFGLSGPRAERELADRGLPRLPDHDSVRPATKTSRRQPFTKHIRLNSRACGLPALLDMSVRRVMFVALVVAGTAAAAIAQPSMSPAVEKGFQALQEG